MWLVVVVIIVALLLLLLLLLLFTCEKWIMLRNFMEISLKNDMFTKHFHMQHTLKQHKSADSPLLPIHEVRCESFSCPQRSTNNRCQFCQLGVRMLDFDTGVSMPLVCCCNRYLQRREHLRCHLGWPSWSVFFVTMAKLVPFCHNITNSTPVAVDDFSNLVLWHAS